MLCAKFGLTWPSGSEEEEDENVKSSTDGQQAIKIFQISGLKIFSPVISSWQQ